MYPLAIRVLVLCLVPSITNSLLLNSLASRKAEGLVLAIIAALFNMLHHRIRSLSTGVVGVYPACLPFPFDRQAPAYIGYPILPQVAFHLYLHHIYRNHGV